jgi:predicted TPR repeat methyltransferase
LFGENGETGIKAFLRVAKLYEEQGTPDEALKVYRKIDAMNCPESKYARERIQIIESGQAAKKAEGGR